MVLFVYAVIQGAFDVFGGHILPTEYGRTRASGTLDGGTTRKFAAFFAGWLRGVLAHSAVLFGAGLTLLWATRMGGFGGAVAAFAVISVILLAAQAGIAALIASLTYRRSEPYQGLPVTLAACDASYFTGGIAGLPGLQTLILPEAWNDLPEDERRAVLCRKVGAVKTGSWARGIALAIGFNLAGFALAGFVSGGTASVAGLVSTSLWFTLWSFIGLLILPTPSQAGVFEVDVYAAQNGDARLNDGLKRAIRRIDASGDDEPARPGGVERIFHPIPSVERRIAAISVSPHLPNAKPGAWHAARMAIYLSWAGMSLLSRAVHCNSGRPDAWVFLPSD